MELKFFIILAVVVRFCNNAAISDHEQKRYKQFLEGQGLYSADDDLEILTISNFKRVVSGAPHAWLIEFYNSWCGFCQRFAPSWRALGTDVKGWSDLVKIGVIDCSAEDNAPVCREYEIMGYPTLRYFHENYQPGAQDLGVGVAKGEDFNEHRKFLIEHVIDEQNQGRGGVYPNLLPFSKNLSQIFDDTPSNVQYAFLVVDKPGQYLGVEVALDLHKTPGIAIRYVFNSSDLVERYKITKLPALITINRNNELQLLSQEFETRDQLRLVLTTYLLSKQVKITDETPQNKEIFRGKWLDVEVPEMAQLMQDRARQALKERVKKMGDVVFQMDLETALRNSLKHEIATVKIITGEKLTSLRNYLDVLRKYFPFGHKGQVFLIELWDYARNNNEIEGVKISDAVTAAERDESQVFSSPQQWLGCRGSKPNYRGYPCGLWKLFHYLTVNAVEQNGGGGNPREVLEAMHGYIKNYFGCADCSQHFQEMAQNREIWNVSSPDSSILWLWMAHNEVNKRLAGDQTEDPEYPKYQFPSKDNCAQCKDQDNSWNLPEVLKYVKKMYSSINVRYIGSDTRILHLGLQGDVTNGSSGIFKTLDASMCFLLYVSSFFLLAVLIRMFLKRGYRKKPYPYDHFGKGEV